MSSPEGSTVIFRRVPPDVRPRAITNFARRLQREVGRGRAFDCLIAGDAELRRWNRAYRGKDCATDVLSFPTGDEGRGLSYLGDIAISAQRAHVQARQFGHTTEQEVRILMLHGLLHLLGHDHEEADGGKMARMERRWRTRLGLPNGLIERAHT
jgi:probable rRNA maturation factor